MKIFSFLIFCPYWLGKACGNNDTIKVNLLDKEEINNRIADVLEIKNDKGYDMQSKYCLSHISIQWMKELDRNDPAGASLCLNLKITLFWRIFIPLPILTTIAIFISSNSGLGLLYLSYFN